MIREFGGDMKETYGVPVEEIVEGIKHGVRKVNIDTDLRLASTGAIRRFLAQNKAEFDPRKYFAEDHGGRAGDLHGALRGLRHCGTMRARSRRSRWRPWRRSTPGAKSGPW